MLYDKIMFDLDGTLIHSKPGILRSLGMMMREMGLPAREEAYMCNLIGPPFQLGFSKYLGLAGEDIQRAIDIYRRCSDAVIAEPGMLEPFPGVPEMLKALRDAGAFVGVVTSKGARPATQQLTRFGFMPCLDYVCTADDQGNGEKTDLLARTCAEVGKEGLVMVGDRFYDLEAATTCGVPSIGVFYGYGTREEVMGCHPTHTVESVAELQTFLLQA